MEKLWTSSEVARFLGIQEEDIEQLVREGLLTGYQLGGRFLRFRPSQVEAVKGTLHTPSQADRRHGRRSGLVWAERLREFLYFYDFYLVSATLLAAMVVYLMVTG